MNIQVRRGEYKDVEALREMYRMDARCQIVADSSLRRGFADAYLIVVNGQMAGYGGVYNKYDPGRLTEFYVMPFAQQQASPMFRELLKASGATEIAARTNIPRLLMMLYDCAHDIRTEKILFADAFTSTLAAPFGGLFRAATEAELAAAANRGAEVASPWVVECSGEIVAEGGFLTHYNPPYGDVFMEVRENARRRGFGSFLVQEVKRVCYDAGRIPAARCSPENVASRGTLEKAGLLVCGRILVGEVAIEK
jgi:GNAT superfamily N-acetyltransferase